MRKILLVAGLLLCLPMLAQAQDAPKAELFTGYSYLRFRSGGEGLNGNGFNVSLTANVTKNVGLVAEFARQTGSESISLRDLFDDPSLSNAVLKADGRMLTFLFGPRFTARSSRVEPFAHALFGGARFSAEVSALGVSGSDSDTSFAFVLGGGLDVKLNDKVAIRLGQLDYLRTRIGDEGQNNFRYSAGLVFRLGKK